MTKKKLEPNSKIKVEKNIPLPENRRHKYPFAEMEVGDSFLYSSDRSRTTQQRAYNAANAWATKRGNKRKFATRATEEGIRIWRVK